VNGLFVTVAAGVLLIAIGIPLRDGRIRRNGIYGFRTPRTLRDDRAWYRANAVFGRAMVRSGWLIGLASAVFMLLGYSAQDDMAVAVVGLAMMVPMLAGVVAGFRASRAEHEGAVPGSDVSRRR
jgi:uncharacterized membrane protein